jgi:hypothetical protein
VPVDIFPALIASFKAFIALTNVEPPVIIPNDPVPLVDPLNTVVPVIAGFPPLPVAIAML